MSMSWQSDTAPDPVKISALGWLLIGLRTPLIGLLVIGCLLVLILFRAVERPMFGSRRPVTSYVPKYVSRVVLWVMGFRYKVTGEGMRAPGAVVANHASWLDIFTLNAAKRIVFVSKAEVASWPGIGWLARATGTVFIERNRAKARDQALLFEAKLQAGQKLLFFPEGTSTDGCRVLPFKTTLFAPFVSDALRDHLAIQPVSVIYHAPKGAPARYYGWWGDMDFGENLLKILATPRQGVIEVVFHTPLHAADFKDRKTLAAACQTAVHDGFYTRK